MADDLKLQSYLDEVNGSSKRTRQIVYILATASIVVFAAYWNSRSDNWTEDRLRTARNAQKWYHTPVALRDSLPDNDRKLFDDAQDYIRLKPITKPEEIEKHIDQLERIKKEHVQLVSVPVFGLVF